MKNTIIIKLCILYLLVLITAIPICYADEKLKLELSIIRGNKERAQVLYIVPWKRIQNKEIKQKLVLHNLFEFALAPIDAETFRRKTKVYLEQKN